MDEEQKRSSSIAMGVVAFCLMVAALGYLFLGDTAVAQMWRLPRAQRHREVILQRLADDPRFQNIKVNVGTTNGGGIILIYGSLPSDDELEDLKRIIASTDPPAHVQYRVVIHPK
jgi:hypothetical protein